MGLVYRNGRPYLYESVRRGGRVTSRYVANGEYAVLLNALETHMRAERRADRDRVREERKELDDLERALDEMTDHALALARDALTAAGYHQHHRGEWRKRRG